MFRGSCRRGLVLLWPVKLVGAAVATLQFQFALAKQLDVEPWRSLDPFFWFYLLVLQVPPFSRALEHPIGLFIQVAVC